ncbi:uncharacterized protein LOC131289304 [Anopheles ziemanni]|uniref:uncharacterized protein LOC131289304 n=1 Tax=Anopheles ziemanni TaxID=345580 RepID=UPI00265FF6FC|nr:uncharacterized protein LOC131289304 [Anopheles ziemanni]
MMADTPTNTSAHVPPASTSGNGDPSVIPQWKKELIQRRKNLAKTIGAVATQVHDSASTVAAAISASASSPVTPHPRTPTGGGAFPVGSPFYAGAGTKEGSTATNTNTDTDSPLDTVPDSERQHPVVESKENDPPSLLLGTDSTDKSDSLPSEGEGGGGGGGDVMTREDEGKVVIARDNNPHCSSVPLKGAAATSPTVGVHFGAHFGGANEPAQQQQHQHHNYHPQQQQQRSSVGGSVRTGEAVLVPTTTPPPPPPLAASGTPSSSSGGSVSAGAANGPQSHSNAGSEHSGSSSSSCSSGSSTVAAAIATATSSARPNSVVIVDREIPSVSNNSGGVVKGSSLVLSPGQQQTQQQQQQREGAGVVRKMVAATAAEEIVVVYEKNNSVLGGGPVVDVTGGVGGGGGGGPGFGDAGEELKYGPGIVSRLRCRYLSLALRQSVTKQRPSLNSMRRATSLNNLLDEESEDLSEREQSIGSEGGGGQHQNHHHHHHQHQQQAHQQHQQHQQKKYHSQNYHYQQQQQQQQQREHYANGNGNNHNHNHNHLHQKEQQQQPLHATVVLQPPYQKQQPQFAPKQPWIHQQQQQQEEQQVVVKTAAPFLRGVQNSYTRASRQVEKKNEYNRYTKHHRGGGGADAVLLKRARSVEALVRYDHHKAWERDATTGSPPAAAAAAAIAPVAAAAVETVVGGVSSSEVGSNVIILDEIATPTTTATSNGGGGGVVVVASATAVAATTTLESNGISSSGPGSGAPMAATAPTAMMMNGGGAVVGVGTRGAAAGTDLPLLVSDCVTIEEKIINGREKGDPKPKRLTSFIDADERPPPDVVKQTMKIFEANANRRGGRANGGGGAGGPPGSDVASKVANYRSIIISGTVTTPAAPAVAAEKPPITHPKPPLSPKKPNIKPRTASPKHQAPAPAPATTATVGKPPPSPKSLEAVNNLKNASGNSNGTIGSTTGQRNNKPSATVVESLGGTPPSPPARSKHASSTSNGVGAAAAPGSVGAVNKNSMQSNGGGSNSEMMGEVTTHSAECAPDESALEPKNNALKNGGAAAGGGIGGVRDHHHNSYENGLTQTAATAVVVAASKTATGSDSGHQHMHNAAASSNTAQGAAASSSSLSSSSPSPAGGICESPSIQQLTSKLASLHLATSTPTGAAGANGTTNHPLDNAAASQDRRNLEYVTSDEEEEDDDDDDEHDGGHHHSASYTVNPDSGSEEDRHPKVGNRDADDDGDDEREEAEGNSDDDVDDAGDDRMVRKISRTAMENIARAGTTTQFRFNGTVKSSYLPGVGGGGVTLAAPSTKPPAPPIPMSRESLGPAKSSANGVTAAAGNNEANGSAGRSPSEVAGNNSGAVNNGSVGGAHNDGVVAGGGSPLTRREIEKNQINREKSGEVTASAVSGTSGNSGAGVGASPAVGGGGSGVGGGGVANASVQKLPTGSNNNNNSNGSSNSVDSTKSFVAKWGTGGGQSVAAASSTAASPLAGLVAARKKAKPPPSQQDGTNTMVFNFSDRKDVPDYIENDGVIIRPRPRELPKPGESGFVVLGDLTLETSTDPDEALDMGPPSPCNGEFANAYIVINGKSSMRNKTSRSNKFKIQFDDSLTSTYEYPSETSLLEPTNGLDVSDSGPDTSSTGLVPPPFATDNGLLSHTNKLLSSVPLGSAPFASYTPVKAAIDTTFELGVTRTPSPSATSTASSNGSHSSSSSNSHHQSATSHSINNDLQQHQQHQQQHQQHSVANGHRHQLIDRPNGGLHTVASNGHSNGADTTLLLNGLDSTGLNGTGEPESIQYLKPASDEQTVNWSQGTRVTDLLF